MNKERIVEIYQKLNPTSSLRIWKLRNKAIQSSGILKLLYTYNYNKQLGRLNSEIPLSTKFSKMPVFPHGIKGIFISSGAEIGDDCVIFQQVTIGSNTLKDSKGYGAPRIGNSVFIGAGAKIVGGITIGDNVRIGANCVVVSDIPANSTVVLEKPRVIIHGEKTVINEFYRYKKR